MPIRFVRAAMDDVFGNINARYGSLLPSGERVFVDRKDATCHVSFGGFVKLALPRIPHGGLRPLLPVGLDPASGQRDRG